MSTARRRLRLGLLDDLPHGLAGAVGVAPLVQRARRVGRRRATAWADPPPARTPRRRPWRGRPRGPADLLRSRMSSASRSSVEQAALGAQPTTTDIAFSRSLRRRRASRRRHERGRDDADERVHERRQIMPRQAREAILADRSGRPCQRADDDIGAQAAVGGRKKKCASPFCWKTTTRPTTRRRWPSETPAGSPTAAMSHLGPPHGRAFGAAGERASCASRTLQQRASLTATRSSRPPGSRRPGSPTRAAQRRPVHLCEDYEGGRAALDSVRERDAAYRSPGVHHLTCTPRATAGCANDAGDDAVALAIDHDALWPSPNRRPRRRSGSGSSASTRGSTRASLLPTKPARSRTALATRWSSSSQEPRPKASTSARRRSRSNSTRS